MKKVTNKIIIITLAVIFFFVVVSSLILVKKINDQTIYDWLPEQIQKKDTTSNIKVHFFDDGFIKVEEEKYNACEEHSVIVETTSDSDLITFQ